MIDINLAGSNRLNNITDDRLKLFFQEIVMLFTIEENDTFGYKNTLNLRKYVFSTRINKNQIINSVLTMISQNCPHSIYFKYQVEVEILKGKNGKSDVLYIALIVDTPDGEQVAEFLIGT